MIIKKAPKCEICDEPIERHQNNVKISIQQGTDFFIKSLFSNAHAHLRCIEEKSYVNASNASKIPAKMLDVLSDKHA